MAQDFEWYLDENSQDIVFPSVQAVAVYRNTAGHIVIRQQDSRGDEDAVVLILPAHAEALIAAVRAAADKP